MLIRWPPKSSIELSLEVDVNIKNKMYDLLLLVALGCYSKNYRSGGSYGSTF